MRKRNNSYLVELPIVLVSDNVVFFRNQAVGITTVGLVEQIREVLMFCASLGYERVRVYWIDPERKLTREAFYGASSSSICFDISLDTYIHATRSAAYTCCGVNVLVSDSRVWSDEENVFNLSTALNRVSGLLRSSFGFGLMASPAMTGAYQAEHSLPFAVDASLPDENFLRQLHVQTTQGRTEVFLPKVVASVFHYDRRFAYAADCRLDLPVGLPMYSEGGEFLPFVPGWYVVEYSIPKHWRHVGLLPSIGTRLGSSASEWTWPRQPGFVGISFASEPEIRLAVDKGWKIRVIERWLFASGRPLETWRNKLVILWESENKLGHKAEADIIRRVLLQGLGVLYARTYRRERVVSLEEWASMRGDEALSAEMIDEGAVRLDDFSNRDGRHYMPHWTAYTWARARTALAKQMLVLPFESILGCHVDAIFTSDLMANVKSGDDVKPGVFRLKGARSLSAAQRVETKSELYALVKGGE